VILVKFVENVDVIVNGFPVLASPSARAE